MIPRILASQKTFFLICLLVAPILLNIPYCLIFSVMEMSKLFLIQNTDVKTIIRQTIMTTTPSPPTALFPSGLVSNSIR